MKMKKLVASNFSYFSAGIIQIYKFGKSPREQVIFFGINKTNTFIHKKRVTSEQSYFLHV